MNRLYGFGPFCLDCAAGVLQRHGSEIKLTAKAFATLVVLVENAGRLVSKQELLDRVWPDGFVEPGNLTQTIYVLRGILERNGASQQQYIITVPGRGYRFVAAVRELDRPHSAAAQASNRPRSSVAASFYVASVAAGLMALLLPLLLASSVAAPPRSAVNPTAQRYYVLGRHYWSSRTDKGVKAGLRYFKAALNLNPDYAQAYAGLSDAYTVLGFYSSSAAQRQQLFALSQAAARDGIATDPTVAEPHASLARVLMERSDEKFRGEVEAEFRTAVTLDPGYASAHQWYSWFLFKEGKQAQGLEEMTKAHDLDPLSPVVATSLTEQSYLRHQYAAAAALAHQALSLEPDDAETYYMAGLADSELGHVRLAIREFSKALGLCPKDPDLLGALAYVYAKNRHPGTARQLMRGIESSKPTSAYNLALVNAALGQRGQALRWLGVAKARHDPDLEWLTADPRMASLERDPSS